MSQKQNDDPHDVLIVAPDVALVVPTDEELAKLAQTMRHSSSSQIRSESDLPAAATVPPVDTTFRPTVSDPPGRGRTIGGRAARAFKAALLLAVGAGAAAFAWQAYGDEAKSTIAQWVPQRVLAVVLPLEKPTLAEQPPPPAVEAATADTQPASPAPAAASAAATVDTPPAQPAPRAPAIPAAAAPSVEPAEQLRSMARDLASAGQQIEQLKASIEELKASQQQMSREIAKTSEAKTSEAKTSEAKPSDQNLRPRLAAIPPRPAATRARKPMPPQAATYPALPPPAAPPYAPRQVEPLPQATTQTLGDPELASVPRPPMPVR